MNVIDMDDRVRCNIVDNTITFGHTWLHYYTGEPLVTLHTQKNKLNIFCTIKAIIGRISTCIWSPAPLVLNITFPNTFASLSQPSGMPVLFGRAPVTPPTTLGSTCFPRQINSELSSLGSNRYNSHVSSLPTKNRSLFTTVKSTGSIPSYFLISTEK
jgi:hypothetical protein